MVFNGALGELEHIVTNELKNNFEINSVSSVKISGRRVDFMVFGDVYKQITRSELRNVFIAGDSERLSKIYNKLVNAGAEDSAKKYFEMFASYIADNQR